MSRKMMLLRSRTSSSGVMRVEGRQTPTRQPSGSGYASEEYYGSSPTLMDVGNLAPEQPEERRASTVGSWGDEDDMSKLPQFLAKYPNTEGATTDEELEESSSPVSPKYGYAVTSDDGLEEKRRQQAEEEYNSAVLSKRAEAILANAKKRLNVRLRERISRRCRGLANV